MQSPSGTSSAKKRAALSIKMKAAKKKTTKNSSKEFSIKGITRAITRTSMGNVAAEPKLFWIAISNVHEKVAYEDIVRVIFQQCVEVSSKSDPSILGGHFQDNIEVAFETKKDAEEAVNLFQNKIILFGKRWRIHHHSCSNYTPSSSLRVADIKKAAEFFDDGQIRKAAAAGGDGTAQVNITNIDKRVPKEVVKPLFEIAGKVRKYEVSNDSDDTFEGTVEYERSEDAVAAVNLFDDNITFFGKTWFVMDVDAYDDNDEDDDNDDDDDDNDDIFGDDDDDDDDEHAS